MDNSYFDSQNEALYEFSMSFYFIWRGLLPLLPKATDIDTEAIEPDNAPSDERLMIDESMYQSLHPSPPCRISNANLAFLVFYLYFCTAIPS